MPVFDPGVPWLRGTATLTNGSTTVETDGVITLNEILEGDRLYVFDGGQRIGPFEIVGGEGAVIELREAFEGATGSYSIAIDRNPITPIGAKILRDMSDVLGRIGGFGELAERDQIAADLIPIGPERDAIKDALDVTKRAANLSDLTNLKEARSNLGTFSSVAEVQSRHIPAVLESIRTEGYYSSGDGGGAIYKRAGIEPEHGGKFQDGHGQWWEIAERTLHVRMFGALGDGVANDSAAVQAAIETLREGQTLEVSGGTYIVEHLRIEGKHDIRIAGPGVLKVRAGTTEANHIAAVAGSNNVVFEGLTFDGSKESVTDKRFMIRCWDGQDSIVFERCLWRNSNANALAFVGCTRSGARNCVFLDIGNLHDITGVTSGPDDDRRNAIVYNGGVDNCFAEFCLFDEIGRGCIAFSVGGGTPPTRCYAIGNTITNVDGGVIYLSHAEGFRVTDNYIRSGEFPANGIETENSSHGVVANNVVEGCGTNGINIGYSAHDILVANNVCRDNNLARVNQRAGINMTISDGDEQSHITITGNKCYDSRTGSDKTQLDAFSVVYVSGSPSIDIDTIRIDESNDFTSYNSSGEEVPNALRRGDRIGVTQFPQHFSLIDGETFVLCGDTMRGSIDLFSVNSASAAKVSLRPGDNPKTVYDPDELFETSDTGSAYAVYRDEAIGKVVLKNRFGATRIFRVSSDRLGPA